MNDSTNGVLPNIFPKKDAQKEGGNDTCVRSDRYEDWPQEVRKRYEEILQELSGSGKGGIIHARLGKRISIHA